MKVTKLIFLAIALLFVSLRLSAQSIRAAETGQEFARKISDNLYEPVPPGVVSYKLVKGEYWELYSGEPISDKPKGYIKTFADKTCYYDRDHNMIAYYVPSEKRFYGTSAIGDVISKEAQGFVFFNGGIYTGDEKNSLRFLVDEDFSLDWLGFFVTIF